MAETPALSDVAIPLTVGIGAWFAAMPSLRDVRKADPDNVEFRHELRHTEMVVLGITIVVGIVAVSMVNHHAPLSAAVVCVGALMLAYEHAFVSINPN